MLLLLIAIAVAAIYLISCRIWPFGPCLVCGGDGKRRSPSGKAWRRCRRCRGTGMRLRAGRYLINHVSESARKSSKP